MTRLEARIRRRLRPLSVSVFRGDEAVFAEEEDVVKLRREGSWIRIWTYWRDPDEVTEWWFPDVDEVRLRRG